MAIIEASRLIACANDPTQLPEQRHRCMLELFREHVTPGTALEEILDWGPMASWFDGETLFDANKYSSVPVSRSDDDSVFMFKPHLLAASGSAIYIRLSKPIRRDELLALIARHTADRDLKVLEIAVSDPSTSY